MKDDPSIQGDSVRLIFKNELAPDALSERELECLRVFLPELIMELVQAVSQDEE